MSGRKRKKREEGGGAYWMDTYGDMVTLLMTFFVLLFSFSTIDAKKWEEIVSSFTGQRLTVIQPIEPGIFEHGVPGIDITDKNNEIVDQEFDDLYQQIKKHVEENELGGLTVEKTDDNTILLRITESVLFDSAQDIIKVDAYDILNQVGTIFNEYRESIGAVLIEGHTDNRPINNAKFESNWELSACRAAKVVRYFLERFDTAIDKSRFSATGCEDNFPVASNTTEEGRAKNRRVDFIIVSTQSDLRFR